MDLERIPTTSVSKTDDIEHRFSLQSFAVLNELRNCGQLTDAIINVENQSFHIHKAVMSACSPYFRALFTNELFNTNRKEVVITGLSADNMRIIVDYAYTRQADVTADNVEQLLPAANQFLVSGIVKACSDFLVSELFAENCIGIYKFSKVYYCHALEKASFRYLMKHFVDVCIVSQEFLLLTAEELEEIISRDELNVKNEEIVFDAILHWINFDPLRRKCYIANLLRGIRLGLLSTQYFVERVKVHPYVRETDASKPVIIETLKFLYNLDIGGDRSLDITNPLAKPRLPYEILFAIGGWSGGNPTNTMEIYDARADHWAICNTMDTGARAYHGTVSFGQILYIIGGFDGAEYFNSVRSFDPVAKIWTEVAPMNAKRCYVSTAVLDGMIYAVGGFDGHNRQNSAERYFPKTNQWSMIQPMNHQRSDASAASLNGKIYICGGFNGQECQHTAEYYDAGTNQWTMMAPMRNRRSGVSVVAYRDNIYAIGGFNGITRMNTVERYYPITNMWHAVPDMFSPRSNFAAQVLDDTIFVIGGFNGMTTIANVECYDGTIDEWYEAAEMRIFRSAVSACVVSGLPNTHDYIDKNRKLDSGKRRSASSNE